MFQYMANWSKLFFSIALRALYCLPAGCLAIDEGSLKKKMEEPISFWMQKQIQRDLEPFRDKRISSELLDKILEEIGDTRSHLLVRFTVIDGNLTTTCSIPEKDFLRLQGVKNAIEKLNSIKKLPNLDLIVTLHDSYSGQYPFLAFAKNKYAEGSILIPDFEALIGYQQLTTNIFSANSQYPWDVKLKRAFWRGSSTGGDFTLDNWQSFPRAKLVLHSFSSPRDLDARFTSLVQMDNQTRYYLTAKGFLGMPYSPNDHIRYKYLVEVDGNSCSYSRCYWELLSNSVMLKQVSDNIQWYYGALKPYQHFIPLDNNLADFFIKLAWARSHDHECREIAEKATEFAQTELSSENIYLYLYFLLEEYAKICDVSIKN